MLRIETEMRGELPMPGHPDVPVIEHALKIQCAQALTDRGCDPNSIEFQEPWYEEGAWKIRGTGKEPQDA